MRDISVVESEDLPKILEPLVEAGPQAALGRPSQKGATLEVHRKQLLQTVKVAAPGIVKLQASPCCMYRLWLHGTHDLIQQLADMHACMHAGTFGADERQTS